MIRSFIFFAICFATYGSDNLRIPAVTMNTAINDVYHRGLSELTGSIVFEVTDDAFDEIAPGEPIYIAMAFEKNAVLATTLVDQSSSDPNISQPVHLPLRLDGQMNASMVADPTAVSIVRWVAGEGRFWLRVSQSSDEWLDVGGVVQGPSVDNEVSWMVGVSAFISDISNEQDAAVNNSNLPFSTRSSTAQEGDFAQSISTVLCVDLSSSTLTADNSSESALDYWPLPLDYQADIGNGQYSTNAGNQLAINFLNDFTVGRGKGLDCALTQFISSSTFGSGPGGLLTVQQPIDFNIECQTGFTFIHTDLVRDSFFRLEVTTPAAGFSESGLTGFDSLMGYLEVDPSSAITVDGQTLYTRANLVYDGDPISLNFGFTIFADADIWYDPEQIDQVDFTVTPVLMSHEGALDQPPYDGPEQGRRCPPSALTLDVLEYFNEVPGNGPCLLSWPETNVLGLIEIECFFGGLE